jgi:hypothetical protein
LTTTDADVDPITATVILRNDVTDVQTFENITTNSLTVSAL